MSTGEASVSLCLRCCATVDTGDDGTQGNTRVANPDRSVRIGPKRNLAMSL